MPGAGLQRSAGLLLIILLFHRYDAEAAGNYHAFFEYGHSILSKAPHRNKSTCPRDESRWANEVLKEHVLSHLGRNAHRELPAECPLRPELNMFYVDEQHLHHRRHGLWKCGYCHKKFRTEGHLEKHFSRKHVDRTPTNATVCLADLCDSLHCPWFHIKRHSTSAKSTASLNAHCLPAAAARAATECEALADACFVPSRGRTWAAMHTYFRTHFCDALTCDHATRERLLGEVHKAGHRRGTLILLVVVLVLVLVLFYTGLLFWYSETRRRRPPGIGLGGRPGAGGGAMRPVGGLSGAGRVWLPKSKNY